MSAPQRTLDPQGYMSAQDPRTLPGTVNPPVITTPIRTLQTEGNTTPPQVPTGDNPSLGDQFSSIINLLKHYQSGAQVTQSQAEQGQALRDASTPQSLMGASPSQQDAARTASANALQPTIGGAKDVIAQATSAIKDYQTSLSTTETHAEKVMSSILATTDPASLKNLDPKYISKLEKDAGYPPGFLGAAVTYKAKQEALAAAKLAGGGDQNKLENEYRTVLLKEVSSRSGTLGMEDQKINQANHLTGLLAQYYDPKTGNYNVPKAQYAELALGLARLISPTGTPDMETIHQINQKTAAGDLAGAITYLTGTPVTGSSQAVIKNLVDSVERQGVISGENRDQALGYLHAMAPTGLNQDRIDKFDKSTLAKFRSVSDRTGSSSGGTTTMTGPKGTFNVPNGQVDIFKKNGYK